MEQILTIAMPFVGTSLGAAMVFFMKKKMHAKLEKLLLGFAAGVMIAASFWSLIIPSLEMSEAQGGITWLPPVVGFLLGIGFLLLLDSVVPHLHLDNEKPEGVKSDFQKTTMMILAVALHNLPEGMAVGVVAAGWLTGSDSIRDVLLFPTMKPLD